MNNIGEIFGQAATAYMLLVIAFLLLTLFVFRTTPKRETKR